MSNDRTQVGLKLRTDLLKRVDERRNAGFKTERTGLIEKLLEIWLEYPEDVQVIVDKYDRRGKEPPKQAQPASTNGNGYRAPVFVQPGLRR